MILIVILLGWLICAALAYTHKRDCDRARHGIWTVNDREIFLTLCLMFGPVALATTLMVDNKKTWRQEQEEERQAFIRKSRASRW